MMQHLLLIAIREFRQITATKGFWITLLILPLAVAVGPIAQRFLSESDTERVMLIDSSGGDAAAIRERIELDEQRDVLTALARYARRYKLEGADRQALWAQNDRWFTDADVVRFVREGGQTRALAQMRRSMAKDTPAFETPEISFEIVPTPSAVASADPATLDAALAPLLRPEGENKDRKKLDYAVFIPADFALGAPVRLWSDGPPRTRLMTALQNVLTRDLRTQYLTANGVAPAAASAASTIAPAIVVNTPPPGGGREKVLVQSVVPLAMAYILLMSLLLSGSWMLQGLVEERSNKLLETVLACVSPNALMYGKLIGTVAVGLTMVTVWVLCGIGAAYATQGAIADMIRPALAPLSSPWIVLAMLYYFVAGYLIVSMIFLAIGGMTDSIRDAQNYLTPVFLLIVAPFSILVQAVLQGGTGAGIVAMTWIPIYTPFTMLARLGAGVPLWEVIGTMVMLATFIALEILLLGRVFRASLLQAGQKPSLAGIGRMMRRETQA